MPQGRIPTTPPGAAAYMAASAALPLVTAPIVSGKGKTSGEGKDKSKGGKAKNPDKGKNKIGKGIQGKIGKGKIKHSV